MTIRPLLPVFLVLLQSGLTAGRAHAHPHRAAHTQALPVHDLLHLFEPDHEDEDRDAGDHDADAVGLSNVMVSAAPPPAVDVFATTFTPADLTPFAGAAGPSFPIGLPPSTAGPSRPLYLAFCMLTV